jgi:hypothetical protein
VKTDALIDLLATGAGPTQRHAVTQRFVTATVVGATAALLLLLATFGINPQLSDYASAASFWIKMSFTLALAVAGLWLSQRLARPGTTVGWLKWFVALPILAMWILAIVVLLDAQPTARAHLVLGDTWNQCPFNIALLSLPPLLAGIWALRGLAPTRSHLAGAAAGLWAGAIGACVYGLHCSEFAPPFLAIWYLIGVLIPSAIGYLVGPRLLRW